MVTRQDKRVSGSDFIIGGGQNVGSRVGARTTARLRARSEQAREVNAGRGLWLARLPEVRLRSITPRWGAVPTNPGQEHRVASLMSRLAPSTNYRHPPSGRPQHASNKRSPLIISVIIISALRRDSCRPRDTGSHEPGHHAIPGANDRWSALMTGSMATWTKPRYCFDRRSPRFRPRFATRRGAHS